MQSVILACEAMATRFEFVLVGTRPVALRAAGEEAIEEIHRIEALLSLYRPDSVIAALNREAAIGPVRVPPEAFRLLQHAMILSEATAGAFDVTVGPLLRIWGLMKGSGRIPSERELDEARACVGGHWLALDEGTFTVRFTRPGVALDLGSIGKGYALDRAAEVLRERGVEHALLHGGTSTAIAWGQPLVKESNGISAGTAEFQGPGCGDTMWRIAVSEPTMGSTGAATGDSPLAVIDLKDESLSVSAVWGKGFEADGHYFGHVMDPRLGRPVQGALLAAMVLPSATESDALSTALLVRGAGMVELLKKGGAAARCLVVERDGSSAGWRAVTHGISLCPLGSAVRAGVGPATRAPGTFPV